MMTHTTPQPPDLITLYDAAEILGVSHRTIKRYVTTRMLPAYLLPGDEYRVSRRQLTEWVRGRYLPPEGTVDDR